MRKPVFPRIVGLIVLYCVIFVLLAAVQFSRQGNFSRRVGAMLVSGKFPPAVPGGENAPGADGEKSGRQMLAGGARVFFGGLEFRLEDGDNGIVLLDQGGGRKNAPPEYVILGDDSARFHLEGGTEIVFSVQNPPGGAELLISGAYAKGVSALEIPVKPLRSTPIRDAASGRLNISYNGAKYQFARSVQWEENGRLVMPASVPAVSYCAVPDQKTREIDLADYVLPQAQSAASFNETLAAWKEQVFPWWVRAAAVQPDEDMAIAYSGEALRRGSYRAAVHSFPASFVSGTQRGWQSSVFIGGMGTAFRLFIASEAEESGRILQLIANKSPEILKEKHLFEFLATRGFAGLFDQGAELARSLDPASLTLEMVPGVFEGYADYGKWRPGNDNPFERLIDAACRLVSAGMYRSDNRVFVFADNSADVEFNLRLGKSIRAWAEKADKNDWLAIGRSLALSAVALGDTEGAAPAALTLSSKGVFTESGSGRINAAKISAARIYQYFDDGEYFPHATPLLAGTAQSQSGGIWAWTAAPVSAAQTEDTLEISSSFPVGEAHYLIIQGLRPFARLQLYDTSWRSDSQFERYDSSGWVYYRQEQTLIIKMKHRLPVERVRIIFREEVRPEPPPPPPVVPADENSGADNANVNGNAETAP